MKSYLLLFLSLIGVSCTTSKGFVPYDQIGVYASALPGGGKYKDIGPISADSSSFVWDSCDKVATEAVRELLDVAKTRGAATVYNITFDSKSGAVTTPTCLTRWGWFVLWIAPGLGPWMLHTGVNGIAAAKIEGESKTSEIQIESNSDTAKLAAAFVAGRLK